jgi:outer membrane protein TolC
MFRKIFTLFLISSFILASSPVFADEILSLNDLIKQAKEQNPEILAAKKRWEASIARVPQAKSLEDPTVGLAFQYTPGSPFQFNKTPSSERMLSFAQFFPFFGKLSLKGKIAVVESQMLASAYKDKELEIIDAVKNAYYDLFINYKQIELNEVSLVLLEGIARIAQARYATNELNQQEVFKINLEIARLSTVLANLKQEQLAKNTRINSLLNLNPETPVGVPELQEDLKFNQDFESLYRLTIENQPTLLIFSYAIERNKYAKSLAKRSFFPDFMAQIAQRGITSGTIGPWDLMLAFTVPLWFWTKQRYEVKEAIANLEEARATYQAMQNKAFSEVKDLATKITMAENKINLYKTNLIPLLESSINASLAAYSSKQGDLMGLLDNQRMLIETKLDYYKALVDYNMNLADLERTVGLNLSEARK